MLRELPDGSAIMFHPPRDHVCFSHDENSEQKGKRGVASLEERLKILKEFGEEASIAPKSVYRKRILEVSDPTQEPTLGQVQNIKRVLMKKRKSGFRISNLTDAVKDHMELPPLNENSLDWTTLCRVGGCAPPWSEFEAVLRCAWLIRALGGGARM